MNPPPIAVQELKLLAHVAPMPGESLAGFLIRCAEKLRLSSPTPIYHFLTGKAAYQLHERHIPMLSVMCHCSAEELDQLLGFCYWRSGARHWKIDKAFLSKSYFLAYAAQKYCPECLQQKTYWRAQWDLRFYLTCTTHQLQLTTCCPHCTKSLRWNRAHLLICPCGFSLCEARAKPAVPETALIASLIDEKLGFDAKEHHHIRALASVEAQLSGLSLDSLFKVIWLLGCTLPAMSPSSRKAPKAVPPEFAIRGALEVLMEWPVSFGTKMQQCFNRPISLSSASRLDKVFGPLQRYLYREMSVPELQHITQAYEQYARELLGAFPTPSRLPNIVRQLEFGFNKDDINAR